MERQKVQGIQFSEGGFVSRRQAALGTAVEQPGASVEKDLKGCSIGTARATVWQIQAGRAPGE